MNEIKNNTAKQSEKQSRTRGLIPFKKGQSGNPKGKPKVRQFTKLQRQKKSRIKVPVNTGKIQER